MDDIARLRRRLLRLKFTSAEREALAKALQRDAVTPALRPASLDAEQLELLDAPAGPSRCDVRHALERDHRDRRCPAEVDACAG
jgi:hypothetical protein